MIGIEKLEEYCLIGRIEVLHSEKISLDGTEQNEQEPSEGQAHMHVSQPEVGSENFPVDQALKEYLPQALTERQSEESALKPELVRP